jgi:hypothetical protein
VWAGYVKHGLKGIERAGTDIAKDHSQRGKCKRREAAVYSDMVVGLGSFVRHDKLSDT